MEITHDVADDLGRFFKLCARIEAQKAHAIKDAAMHGLEPVARIRQRPVHDRGERVSEIALLKRLA